MPDFSKWRETALGALAWMNKDLGVVAVRPWYIAAAACVIAIARIL